MPQQNELPYKIIAIKYFVLLNKAWQWHLPGSEHQMLDVVDGWVMALGFHILAAPELFSGELVEPDGEQPVEVVANARHQLSVSVHAHGAQQMEQHQAGLAAWT